MMGKNNLSLLGKKVFWIGRFIFILSILLAGYFWLPKYFKIIYFKPPTTVEEFKPRSNLVEFIEKVPIKIIHLETPKPLRSVYLSGYAAGTDSFRQKIFKILDETEINAIVIDIKDASGRISFLVSDPKLLEIGSAEKKIADIIELIDQLHKKNVYVIGRISVFQDSYLAKKRLDLAVRKASQPEQIWKDRKGIAWLDPSAKEVWDYTLALAKESYNLGFDELNFDYIRFPSDGNMKDIYYPWSQDKAKPLVLEEFFKYLNENLSLTGAVLSANLFGMTMTNTDDLNIGQILEKAVPYFDYIAPMVYPSHFPPNWNGFPNPAKEPYEVIKISLGQGVERLKASGVDQFKIRPWLQDFNLGAIYTAELVRAQIQATYDVGLDSWMLWDPKNTYTYEALELKKQLSAESI